MIGSIRGKLLESTPLFALIDVGGLGYEVNIPVTTAEKLATNGEEVFLYTHAVYREDTRQLYGFSSKTERDFFRVIVDKVSGVGPKIALTLMSKMPLDVLQEAIAMGDVKQISKCPGIGKKTAERVIVELKDTVKQGGIGVSTSAKSDVSAIGSTLAPSNLQDAISAMLALGYKDVDAERSIKKAALKLGEEASTQDLIKAALGS